jgi:hypothetical protein
MSHRWIEILRECMRSSADRARQFDARRAATDYHEVHCFERSAGSVVRSAFSKAVRTRRRIRLPARGFQAGHTPPFVVAKIRMSSKPSTR